MKELFKTLMPELQAIVDKEAAINQIKCRFWPLDPGLKPEWYHEAGESDEGKNLHDTMEINFYMKSYLERLINS